MAESGAIRTHRQGRLLLRKFLPKLEQMKDDLRAFEDTLSFPGLEEVDEMLSGVRPVTREAYLCAVVHAIALYVEEAWIEAEQYLEHPTPRLLPRRVLERYQPGFQMNVQARCRPNR